jgi:hypothetical protein
MADVRYHGDHGAGKVSINIDLTSDRIPVGPEFHRERPVDDNHAGRVFIILQSEIAAGN